MSRVFEGMYPVAKKLFRQKNFTGLNYDFEGTGLVLKGDAKKLSKDAEQFSFEAELYIDGIVHEKATFPANFTTRRHELFWKYLLPNGKHQIKLKILNSKSK